jgi:hypothetical protein
MMSSKGRKKEKKGCTRPDNETILELHLTLLKMIEKNCAVDLGLIEMTKELKRAFKEK